MSRFFKIAFLTLVLTGTQWLVIVPEADAGLLRDWLQRRRCNRQCACPQQPLAVNTTAYAGLQPGQCATTCQQTCSRVVVNYVPCTSYRTTYERVPVTQYRPQTSCDPCTGCTVTCMRPCTTYTYRMRRVPYTTYRPVYRTQTYSVPVTTITNNCNPCGVQPTCAVCPTGTANVFNGQVLNGTLTTDGSYGVQQGGTTTLPNGTTITPLPTPADSTPSINPQNSNSVIDALGGGSSTKIQIPRQQRQPANWTLTSSDKSANAEWYTTTNSATSKSPVTRKWKYTPSQKSTYVTLDSNDEPKVTTVRGSFQPLEAKQAKRTNTERQVNEGWETVDW